LTAYALNNRENDFTVFASYYWVKPNKLKTIAAKHEKIAIKLQLVEEFYDKLLKEYSK